MEPLSSFAISFAAGVVLEKYKVQNDTVKKELNKAFSKAVNLWSKNKEIRERNEEKLRQELDVVFENPELLRDIQSNNSEVSSFFNCYNEALSEYKTAYNYLKEIKDLERYRDLKKVTNDTYKMLSELFDYVTKNPKNQFIPKEKKPITSSNLGVRSNIFKKQLDSLKNGGNYEEAINLIIDNFTTYPQWNLLIELLKFCELESSPKFGIEKFKEYRHLLGNTSYPEKICEKEALNYYLGRLYTQIGDFQDAFFWHHENTKFKISHYYQLLSKFELASLYYRIEDFESAISEYEDVQKSLGEIDHSLVLKIHLYLYLSTLYTINTIFNFSSHPYSTNIADNSKLSINYTKRVNKLIPKLAYEDDRNDKSAWANITMAFGLESQGDFHEAIEYYSKAEELIKNRKVTNSSATHIFIYTSRFYRRRKDYHKAIEKINLIKRYCLSPIGSKMEFSIYEEIAYILLNYGKKGLARSFFKHAVSKFRKEKSIEIKMHWPIVKRVSKMCEYFDLVFEI